MEKKKNHDKSTYNYKYNKVGTYVLKGEDNATLGTCRLKASALKEWNKLTKKLREEVKIIKVKDKKI